MKLIKILTVISLIFIGSYAAYETFSPSATAPEVHYITEMVRRGTLEKTVLATGSLRAKQRVEVGAQVSGKIESLPVHLGQAVKKGELIAELNSDTQKNHLSTAQAELLSYQTQFEAKQIALKMAQSQYNRLSKLYRQQSISLIELENAENSLANAKAALEEIKAKIQVADIAVKTAKTNLDYTKIVSPIDGVIISIPVSIGQTVNANQTSPTIAQVADLSLMQIKLEIAEGDIALVQPNQALTFTTLAEPERMYQANIQSIDPALTKLTDSNYTEQSANSEAVYYYANALIDNRDQRLRIGMTVQSKIVIAEKQNVLLIPTTALKKRQAQCYVDVLVQGKAVEKAVTIGLADSQYTEILAGLNEGEQVITTQRNAKEQVGNSSNIRMPRF